MEETVNFVDDVVDTILGEDTDIVKNIYEKAKPIIDFTKSVLRDDDLRIKKLPKRTTVGDLKKVILNSEENLDIVEDIIESKDKIKKRKKAMKLYDYEAFFRKAEKRIPIMDEVSQKMPSRTIFPYILENAVNDFFIYGTHPEGRPDLTMMYQLMTPFTVSKSKKEHCVIISEGDSQRSIEYNYQRNTIKKLSKSFKQR